MDKFEAPRLGENKREDMEANKKAEEIVTKLEDDSKVRTIVFATIASLCAAGALSETVEGQNNQIVSDNKNPKEISIDQAQQKIQIAADFSYLVKQATIDTLENLEGRKISFVDYPPSNTPLDMKTCNEKDAFSMAAKFTKDTSHLSKETPNLIYLDHGLIVIAYKEKIRKFLAEYFKQENLTVTPNKGCRVWKLD